MKTKSFAVVSATLLTLIALDAHGQLVADGATNTLSNVTNAFTGDVIVGTNGSFTLLVLSDNAFLTNSGRGSIGFNPTARSNEVRLVSPSARWLIADTLFVGSNGSFSTLVVSNGARVDSGRAFVSFGTASSNNTAIVTGAGSVWSNQLHIFVGQTRGSNRLLISDGGRVDCSNFVSLGAQSADTNNEVMVTGANSTLNIRGGGLAVGSLSSRNNLLVSQGGNVVGTGGSTLGGQSGASSNTALVTDPGSRWLAGTNLNVGNNGAANRLVVSNGALVEVGTVNIGFGLTGSNNVVVVTGASSVWSNRADMFIGLAGDGNQLVVSNGATVVVSNLFVGFNSSSLGNRVAVDGGTLRVTNLAGTGTLEVRRGTNVLNAGLMEVDHLLLTNLAGTFEFNGGTLSAGSGLSANGQLFRVGRANGLGAATLNLTGNGTHLFGVSLTVSSNGVLTGNGSIAGGLDVDPGGTLAPGAPIGTIVLNNFPTTLQGVVLMEISRNGSVLTNDQITMLAGTFPYGGSLRVTNIGPTALTTGSRFQLFPAGGYEGSFAIITLPSLTFGLRWQNSLLVDGSIEVVVATPPTVQTLPASAIASDAATLNGVANPSGSETAAWFEYGFTTNYGNVTVPQPLGSGASNTNFSQVLTGLFGGITYHFRAIASNNIGVVFGSDQSFGPLPVFAEIGAGLPGVSPSSVAWGDYDNDGRLDILLTGTTNLGFDGRISQVWRNTGSGFTNINAGLPRVSSTQKRVTPVRMATGFSGSCSPAPTNPGRASSTDSTTPTAR